MSMMSRLKRLGAVAVTGLLAAVILAAPASAQTVAELVKKGKVSIGVASGNPPYDSVDANGNLIGYGVDVANLIGQYMGVEVEIVPVNNSSRIAALESGRIDIQVAMTTPTPERAKVIMFTAPYGAYDMSIAARKTTKIDKIEDLKGLTIAVPKASAQDTILTSMNIPDITIKRFDDDALSMQAMLSGQVDATTSAAASAKALFERPGNQDFEVKIPLFTQYYSIGVRKDAFDLLQWLNNTIFYMKTRGELQAAHEKWTGLPLPAGPLGQFPTF